jgi:hypothetical protein
MLSGSPARGQLVDDHDVEDDHQERPQRGGGEPDDLSDRVDGDEQDRRLSRAGAAGEQSEAGQR